MRDKSEDSLENIPMLWNTFLDTPPDEANLETSEVVVVPFPYDSTTSYKTGSRLGPSSIINASKHLEDFDLELRRDISEIGIHTRPEIKPDISGPKAMVDLVRRTIVPIVKSGKFPVLLGGEHTITTGAIQAVTEVLSDVSVLYFDAHADLRNDFMGSCWGHASVARRLYEICPLVHVGLRSCAAEELKFIRDKQLPVFFWGPPDGTVDINKLASAILEHLSSQVYISIDLDVLDPSIMQAVGTPEPGGILWHEITTLLKLISNERKIIGFDVTELSPPEGPEACSYLAAKLVYKLIGYSKRPENIRQHT